MNLKRLKKELNKLIQAHGDDVEVIMADNKPVSRVVFSKEYPGKRNIVITDL